MGLDHLAKRMAELDRKIKEKVNECVKSYADAMVSSMVYNTAVDTSKALSNWRIAIGTQPPVGDIPAHSMGSLGSTRASSGSTMRTIAYAAISMKKSGEEIHLYNNADYIYKLEKGHPQYKNMVPQAISAGQTSFRYKFEKMKLR